MTGPQAPQAPQKPKSEPSSAALPAGAEVESEEKAEIAVPIEPPAEPPVEAESIEAADRLKPPSVTEAWLGLARWTAAAAPPEGQSDPELFPRLLALLRQNFGPDRAAIRVAEAFGYDIRFLAPRDIRHAKSRDGIFFWDDKGFPQQILGRSWSGKIRYSGFTGQEGAKPQEISLRGLRALARGYFVFQRREAEEDRYFDLLSAPPARWLTSGISYLTRRMPIVLIAALTANLCSLGASLFALQVWDRVIPSQSVHTLSVLTLGVIFAMVVEFAIRFLRAQIIDTASERIDRAMSQKVFDKFLKIRSDARPRSIGSMVSQIRDLDHFRELFGSTILTTLIDLVFLVLFAGVVYVIGGPLVLPLLAGIVLSLFFLALYQIPLTRLAKQSMQEASVKSGLIVEAAAYGDQIKGIGAAESYRSSWAHVVTATAATAHSQKMWRALLTTTAQNIQQLAYVSLVVMGAIGVINSQLTMGQVIACSILLNRALSPLMQVAGIMSSLQSALVGKRGIDDFMAKPEDGGQAKRNIDEIPSPALHLSRIRYLYPNSKSPQLSLDRLDIPYGSKVGLLGRVGSGKSTLLRLLAGMGDLESGTIRYSGVDFTAIPAAQLQRMISYVPQNPRLFRGTVRQNLLLGYPEASVQEIVEACMMVNAEDWLLGAQNGMDLAVSETGEGFSGGQLQALALARALVRPAKIILLDEPSANMDDNSERAFIQRLGAAKKDQTLVLATHRPAPLAICERVIVLDRGQIVMDGPRDEILARLRNGPAT